MEFQPLGTVERGWLKQLKALQTEDFGCRWIEGKPSAEGPFCGAPAQPGSSYCAEHHTRAYTGKILKPPAVPKNA